MTGFKLRETGPAEPAAASLMVVSLHTPSHAARADRLADSCRALGLAFALYELPAVHRSISALGVDDPAFTKPAVIRQAIETFGKPVLFVDADIVFRQRPDRIEALAVSCDFAIYNWLADDWTDTWEPIEWQEDGQIFSRRFWGYRHAIDYLDPGQLFCSGGVQLWGISEAAARLLGDWQAAIETFAPASDDECLDFTFNNRDNSDLRYAWLEKGELRMPWWPHVRPVIDHPDPVAQTGASRSLVESDERKRFYPDRAVLRLPPPHAIPRWAVIDIDKGRMMEWLDGRFIDAGPFEGRFWL